MINLECPHCIKPTKITYLNTDNVKLYLDECISKYRYDIDRNITISYFLCEECNKKYAVTGNDFDGYRYNYFGEL